MVYRLVRRVEIIDSDSRTRRVVRKTTANGPIQFIVDSWFRQDERRERFKNRWVVDECHGLMR
jgi:hypothetical protein